MFRGNKVSIGPMLPNDGPAMFRWFNDAEAASLDLAFRPTDWIGFKNWAEALAKDSTKVLFAIRRLDQVPIVGFVGITNIHSIHRSAELGVRIGEAKDRGCGLGREAVGLALDYCWKHLNLNRVSLSTLAGNEPAIKAFVASGFQHEGVARRAAFIDGRWHDLVIMGALNPYAA
jgi:RimJ/RimL family protein N-acetyltransferase